MIKNAPTISEGVQTQWQDPRTPEGSSSAQPNTNQAAQRASNPMFGQLAPRNATPSNADGSRLSVRQLVQRFETGTPPLRVTRSYADAGTQTAMHDVHNHSIGPGYASSQINDITLTLAENAKKQMALFDEAGIDKFVWAPIPTVIIEGEAVGVGCCGNDDPAPPLGHAHLDSHAPSIDGKTYYMEEAFRNGAPMTGEAFDRMTTNGKQHYNTSVDWQVGKAYNELRKSDPKVTDRIFPAITGINLGDANAVPSMLRLKKEYPGTFHYIGEVTVHKEFVDKQNLDYTPDLGERAPINDIFKFAARSGMPVVLHCDSSDAEKCIKDKVQGQGEYFEGIENMIKRHPDTTFVHAHMGGIGKFAPPGENHVAQLRHMLKSYPHYHLDMSWDVVAENYSPHSKLTDPEAREADETARRGRIEQMAELINEYPDRFIMGSDALVSRNAASISATYGLYANRGQGPGTLGKSGLFDYLSSDKSPQDTTPDVLSRILSGNFDKLLTQAKTDSLNYERNGMADDLARIQQRTELNKRTPNTWRQ